MVITEKLGNSFRAEMAALQTKSQNLGEIGPTMKITYGSWSMMTIEQVQVGDWSCPSIYCGGWLQWKFLAVTLNKFLSSTVVILPLAAHDE